MILFDVKKGYLSKVMVMNDPVNFLESCFRGQKHAFKPYIRAEYETKPFPFNRLLWSDPG